MSDNEYKDILDHPHRVSSKRPRMSLYSRAAQFSPFAALTGYDEEIDETARLTDHRAELTEDELNALNDAIQKLSELELPLITVTYFIPDEKKSGGVYVQYTGHFRFLDMGEQRMKFVEGMEISLSDICGVMIAEEEKE